MVDSHRFTTKSRKINSNGELQWGGGEGWDGTIDQQDGVKVENGSVVPLTLADQTFLEDFEDGDVSDWSVTVETSGFLWQNASSPTHSGSHSGRLYADGQGYAHRSFTRTANPGPYVAWVRQTNDPFDDVKISWQSDGEGTIFSLNFNRETTQNVHVHGNNRGWAFPSDTWVRIVVYNVGFDTGTYDWKVERGDGYVYDSGSNTFDVTSITGIDRVRLRAAHYGRGLGEFYFDDISIGVESP
jgi:hypothetical protein